MNYEKTKKTTKSLSSVKGRDLQKLCSITGLAGVLIEPCSSSTPGPYPSRQKLDKRITFRKPKEVMGGLRINKLR